jgi:hypothetical protein
MTTTTNPYLEEWTASKWSQFDRYKARRECIAKYGFAIPNEEAIQKLVALSPIVEMGAGIGYWASLISAAGGQIEAYDKFLGAANAYSFKHREPWFPVQAGEPKLLTTHTARTLFLSWPCYESTFASECLAAFQGQTVVYIGEGMGGCTANDAFHECLKSQWKEVDFVAIPRWDGIHDWLTVYERQ